MLQLHAEFIINDVVRHEIIKLLRKNIIVEAIIDSLRNDPSLESQYRRAAGILKNSLTAQNLKYEFERIYKYHVRKGDTDLFMDRKARGVGGTRSPERAAGFLGSGLGGGE